MLRREVICQVIAAKGIISFYYNGGQRVVEPYLLGINASDRLIFIGYQTKGYSESGVFPPWRSFELRKVRNLEVIDDPGNSREGKIPDKFELKQLICWRD